MISKNYKNIDEFISDFPDLTEKLETIRRIVHEEVPEVEEAIRYGIPTFRMKGNLVHFSAYKSHIGFYPGASGVSKFSVELKDFDCSKGTIRLPLDRELPLDLIRRIIRFRLAENRIAAELKKSKNKR